MDSEQREQLKLLIKDKIEDSKKTIASYELLTRPISPDNAIGRLTRMEAIASKSINDAALSKARYTLSKLEVALQAIDHPDFGLCRECEEPIPLPRLRIMPEAELCVHCAQALQG